MRKHILIISAVFPPEQVTSAFLNYDLAHELAKKYDVTVLRPYPTRPIGAKFESAEVNDSTFKTVLVDSYTHPESELIGRMKESISFGRKCMKYIKNHHDEIDFIYNGPWQLFGVYIVARVAEKYKIPYLVTVQDIYPESLLTGHHYPSLIQWGVKSLFLPMDKYYTRHAVKVRTISNEMAEYMSRTRKLPLDHYVVLDNWQNDEDFEGLNNKPINNKIVFAYVGSINMHSNVDLIIRAFHDADITNSELLIYGGGNRKEQCVHLVEELKADNIYFGIVNREEVPQVQANADILVLALPKGNGGLCLPSKMTSYMLSGKPILASIDKNSAAVRYITEAKCGIAVDPDNLQVLKDGFIKFGQMSKNELAEMSNNSASFADLYLTRKSNLPKMVDIIEQIINDNSKVLN